MRILPPCSSKIVTARGDKYHGKIRAQALNKELAKFHERAIFEPAKQ
jgi:hypothetical protein